MRTIVFISVLFALFFCSCNKCKDCTAYIETRFPAGSNLPPLESTRTLGDVCAKELKAIDDKTITEIINDNGYILSQTSRFECK